MEDNEYEDEYEEIEITDIEKEWISDDFDWIGTTFIWQVKTMKRGFKKVIEKINAIKINGKWKYRCEKCNTFHRSNSMHHIKEKYLCSKCLQKHCYKSKSSLFAGGGEQTPSQ